jgi:hypothetical protein
MGGKEAVSGKSALEVEGILFKNSKNSDAPGARGIGILNMNATIYQPFINIQ